MRLVRLALLACLVFLALLATACTRANPQYCNSHGDCPSNLCDEAANACIDLDDGDGGVDPADAAPDAMMCETSDSCGGNAPICDEGDLLCRPCAPAGGDAPECAVLDSTRPQCADDGRCVECASSAACGEAKKPVCDGIDNVCRACIDSGDCTESGFETCAPDGACVGCVDHDDCGSAVCDLRIRQCAATDSIIRVGGSGTAADTIACGPAAQPCATLQYALDARVDAENDIILLASGNHNAVLFDGDAVLVVGSKAPATNLVASQSGKPVVEVAGDADVYLDRLVVRAGYGSTSAHGIECKGQGTSLTLRDVEVRANEGRGVVSDCDLTISGGSVESNDGIGVNITGGVIRADGFEVRGNRGGGINVQNTAFHIVNSIIADNGGSVATIGGIRIANFDLLQPQVLAFTTIADNTASDTSPAYGVFCDVVNGSMATFRSNIVWAGNGPTAAVAGSCAFTYSNISGGLAGSGNMADDPDFVGNGDYHLESQSPVKDKGAAVPGVERDLDGQLRDGSPDMGADEI